MLWIDLADEKKQQVESSLAKYKLKSNFQLEIELLTPASLVNVDFPTRPVSDAAFRSLAKNVQAEFLNAVGLLFCAYSTWINVLYAFKCVRLVE